MRAQTCRDARSSRPATTCDASRWTMSVASREAMARCWASTAVASASVADWCEAGVVVTSYKAMDTQECGVVFYDN